MQNKKNPFSISKAVDLTNQEIKKMWANDIDFEEFIEPLSLKPKMIIGGKGTGKTHLMRYFSYVVRSHNGNIKDIIDEDGYLCLYIPGEMLQSKKFAHVDNINNNDDANKWQIIFIYYFGLFVFNTHLIPLLEKIIKEYTQVVEEDVVSEIKDLFDREILQGNTLKEIQKEVQNEIKSINHKVNNYTFSPEGIDDIDVSIGAEVLFFDIPKIIKKLLKNNDLVINYFIDEFEDFAANQQKYIQTLIRDSGDKCTFRLGIRSHAYNSNILKTEKEGEPNKIGSEIEKVILDDWLIQNDTKYKDFILQIIQKRIENTSSAFKEHFSSLFEIPLKNEALNSDKSFKNLKKDIKTEEGSIKKLKIIADIEPNQKALLEKVNIYLLYRELKKKQTQNIDEVCSEIRNKCTLYLNNSKDNSDHKKIIEKQKDNLMAQLYKENNKENPIYFGLDNLIKISNHNPRHFINFMAHLYDYADYFDENPSKGFSVKIQSLAIDEIHRWFENDYYKDGKYGDKQILFSTRICRYLRSIRLSPKPIVTSIIRFYVTNDNYLKFKEQFKILYGNRILIRKDDRLDKQASSHNQSISFQINLIYAKKYTLPIGSRGTVEFNETMLNVIFNASEQEYSKFITEAQKEWKKIQCNKYQGTKSKQQEIFN